MSFGTCTTAPFSVRSSEVMTLGGLPFLSWPGIRECRRFDSERLRLDETVRKIVPATRQTARTEPTAANSLDWGNRRTGGIYEEKRRWPNF
jgi:hypothetical protein